MADIFISYSKADRELALKLSAFLEAGGWTVWWDKSLKPADTFRDEIMKELAKARAVITIWTENSISSDWVRAEAGRAKADGKLIPLKTSGVAYGDIPLPFGEMHTEDLSKTELVQAAVVAQLAKPEVAPSALLMSIKSLRYQVLTWVGVVGGAITLFTNLDSVLRMADWARWLVTHWHDWMHASWEWVFAWIGIRIDPEISLLLSFLAFMLSLSIGIWLRVLLMTKRERTNQHHVRDALLFHKAVWVFFTHDIWLHIRIG